MLIAFARIAAPLRLIADSFNLCSKNSFGFYFKSLRPLAGAAVRWPGHDVALDLRADTYRIPLADRGVPDTARLVLTYR